MKVRPRLVPAAFATALILVADPRDPSRAQRAYHPTSIRVMAAADPRHWQGLHTHVILQAFVTLVRLEPDGDLHIRLCDSPEVRGMDRARCIVAECIPELPCSPPRLRTRVEVRGIARYDADGPSHRWWEIHPVEKLETK